MGFTSEQIEQILAAIRAGSEVVVGGSRCHTSYFVREGELIAQDFDEGMTTDRACSEMTLRAVIESSPESFVELLRAPVRARLAAALLDPATRRGAIEPLAEVMAFGSPSRLDLVAAALAWPEERPTSDVAAALAKDTTGLDAYHAIMSALGYPRESPAVAHAALWFFSTVFEMLGGLRELRRYRAGFRAMAGDRAGALEDLEWEKAHQAPGDPDAEYLQREIDRTRG